MAGRWLRTEANPTDYVAGVVAGLVGALEILGVMGVTYRRQRGDALTFPRQLSSLVLGEDAARRRNGVGPAAVGVGLHVPSQALAGALFALLASRVVVLNRALMGLAYGLGLWWLVWGVVFPRLRPGVAPTGADLWILGAAHAVFGFILGSVPMRWTAGGVRRVRRQAPQRAGLG